MSRMENPKNAKGQSNRMGKLNGALGVGFVGFDSYLRMQDGESAPVALGKSLLTNAAWAMAPGGLVGGIAISAGIAAVQAAPDVINHIDRKKADMHANRNRFGSNFQSSQAQMAMAEQGISQIQNARSHAVGAIANHARGAQRVY